MKRRHNEAAEHTVSKYNLSTDYTKHTCEYFLLPYHHIMQVLRVRYIVFIDCNCTYLHTNVLCNAVIFCVHMRVCVLQQLRIVFTLAIA